MGVSNLEFQPALQLIFALIQYVSSHQIQIHIFMFCCLTTLFNMTDPTYIVMLKIVNNYMLIYMCMCISPCLLNANHVLLLYPESIRYQYQALIQYMSSCYDLISIQPCLANLLVLLNMFNFTYHDKFKNCEIIITCSTSQMCFALLVTHKP